MEFDDNLEGVEGVLCLLLCVVEEFLIWVGFYGEELWVFFFFGDVVWDCMLGKK